MRGPDDSNLDMHTECLFAVSVQMGLATLVSAAGAEDTQECRHLWCKTEVEICSGCRSFSARRV